MSNVKLMGSLLLAANLASCGSEPKKMSGYDYNQANGGSKAKKDSNKDKDQDESSRYEGDATAGGKRDHTVRPPREYYDALFSSALRTVDTAQDGFSLADAAGGDQILYVNFDGAQIQKGFDLAQSFLLCSNFADIVAPDLSGADKTEILALVAKFFEDAGARLVVTSDPPMSGDFTTIHVGGSYADLGCSGKGVLGIAPFDLGNANRNDVGFAFTAGIDALAVIAETIAHEAGHSFGLDHTDNVADLMFASTSDAIQGFLSGKVPGSASVQNGPALLQNTLGLLDGAVKTATNIANSVAASAGNVAAIPGLSYLPTSLAQLPGLGEIAMIGQLLATLSAGDVVDISKIVPQIVAILPVDAKNIQLVGLDKILTIVGLATSAASNQNGNTLPATINGIFNSGILTSFIAPQTAGSVQGVTSLATLAGFGNVGMAISMIQGLLGGATGMTTAATTPATTSAAPVDANVAAAIAALPDFAAILGLVVKDKNLGELVKSLLGTTEIIIENFVGADRDALLSLIKVAYAQVYQDLAAKQAP